MIAGSGAAAPEADEFAFIKFVRIHFTDSKSQTQEGRMPRCPPPIHI